MIIDESTLRVGGSPLIWKIGKMINKWGEKIMTRNKHLNVTNPTAKLVNPFTMIINFTVDITEKWQIVIQGDYKKLYKESDENIPDIGTRDLFIIISENRKLWFKKD